MSKITYTCEIKYTDSTIKRWRIDFMFFCAFVLLSAWFAHLLVEAATFNHKIGGVIAYAMLALNLCLALDALPSTRAYLILRWVSRPRIFLL